MKVVLPKHLTDIEAIELIHGPPDEILTREHFRDYQNWMSDKIIELPGEPTLFCPDPSQPREASRAVR